MHYIYFILLFYIFLFLKNCDRKKQIGLQVMQSRSRVKWTISDNHDFLISAFSAFLNIFSKNQNFIIFILKKGKREKGK